ncbi:hypothetical protein JCM11251_002944 [Rhodosporidiobolus azoricus]
MSAGALSIIAASSALGGGSSRSCDSNCRKNVGIISMSVIGGLALVGSLVYLVRWLYMKRLIAAARASVAMDPTPSGMEKCVPT